MKYFLPILFCTLIANSIAQTLIKDSIFFSADNSYRTYKVWLPEDYSAEKKYQTIYCLDASLLFNILTANVEIYSYPQIAKIPPSIVVGLYFDERNDDMAIDWENSELLPTGQSFQTMITKGLIPEIEEKYSTSNYRSIVGHSNSSTFIQFFLWNTPDVFQGYLSMSEYELEKDKNRFCSLTIPSDTPVDFVFISGKNDAEYRLESGIKHQQYLDSCTPERFLYSHITLEHADHLTMVPQGIPLGLEKLYTSYITEIIPTDSLMVLLNDQPPIQFMDSRVSKRNGKYGVSNQYNFDEMNQLFELYVQTKDSMNVHFATQKYAALFQDSSELFYEAQHLEAMGAYKMAENSYLKHLDYYNSPGVWSYKRLIWLYAYKLHQPQKAYTWCETAFSRLRDDEFLTLKKKLVNQFPTLQ